MAQYMLLIYDEEAKWAAMSESERGALVQEYFGYTEELRSAGAFVAGDALNPVAEAKTVSLRDGERLVVDGPFAETKEQLGGYYLIDVADEQEALEWAAKVPSAKVGKIEVRPVMVIPAGATA